MKPFDDSGAFRPSERGVELLRLAVRGVGVTVVFQGLALAIQTIGTIGLARLLLPGDFGLVTMVTTFSLLLMNFGLNGFTEAILQREEIDHFLVSNLFWINVGLGALLTIAFAAAAPLLAWFYGEPRVTGVGVAIALTILFTSVSVQHLALLMRAMRFWEVSVNGILARTVSVVLSIVLAWAGWGYWALVAGAVALPLATSIGAWVLCRWTPGLPRRVAGTSPMVQFAMNTYGRFTVNYFARNLDNLLVGWRFDARALGFYKKGFDVFILPAAFAGALSSVVISSLRPLMRDAAERRRYLLAALSTVAFVGMGLGAVLTLVGTDLMLLLLGPGWNVSGRIFTFFGPGIGMMLLYGTHSWIHLSIGSTDRWFRWALVEFAVTTVLFILGLRWGPVGVAAAWAASFWILTVPALWYAGNPIQLRIVSMIGAVWKYVLASAVAACACAAIIRAIPSLATASGTLGAIARIVMVFVLFGPLYLCAVILFHRGCDPLRRVARLLQELGLPTRDRRAPKDHKSAVRSIEEQTLA